MKLCAACQNSFGDDLTFCPRDGEVLQESPETIVGRVIDGKYEVESFIAQGGMGAVYLARHILLGDRVVIKTLRPEMRTNAEWLKRFQREGKAARAFRHPNSVTVYDLSAGTDGLIYMVMEFVEGHTLDQELKRRGRFTPDAALEVLEPVADVLDAAHARGVVHRDLKPENIMLGRDERGETVVKVLDLGIAKLVGAGDAYAAGATALTVAGQILGTPYYMSPEQWGEVPRDGRAEVDGRTDVYSLGVIVFELVAGRKPLGGRTLAELRRKHVAEPLPALEEAAPGAPAEFGRAVARAMSKDRGDRPQTAGELIDELRAALGLPPKSRPRSPVRATEANVVRAAAPGSEAATAHLPPQTGALDQKTDALDQSRADTILTSDFETPAPAGERATSAQPPQPATIPDAWPRGGRETAAPNAGETAADAYDRRGVRVEPGGHATPAARARESVQARGDVQTHDDVRAHETGTAVAPPPRRPRAPLVAGGVAALVLLAAAGGWLAWRRAGAGVEGGAPGANASAVETATKPAAAVPKVEAMSYWVETFDDKKDETGERTADASAELTARQNFRFHFHPRERGYLYLVGPKGEGNALVTMLTARGAGRLESNLLMDDADFVYPPHDRRLALRGDAGTTEGYTVIFSPTPLLSPPFLAEKYMRELSPAEVKELEDFRAQHRADAAALEVRGEGEGRRVAVDVPERATAGGAPVIFDIRIRNR